MKSPKDNYIHDGEEDQKVSDGLLEVNCKANLLGAKTNQSNVKS